MIDKDQEHDPEMSDEETTGWWGIYAGNHLTPCAQLWTLFTASELVLISLPD